jgi:hypothetical protein
MMPTIRTVRSLPDCAIEIEWEEGGVSIVSFRETISKGGIFASLGDPEFFAKVIVAEEGDCIRWPGELDFGADSLWYRAHPEATIEELEGLDDPARPNAESASRQR